MSFIRTILLYSTAAAATVVLGLTVIIAALLGIEDKPGGIYDNVPRWWSQAVLFMVGIKVRVHGMENVISGEPHIFASNHVSWFDVPSLASTLPRHRFVAKSELFKVPIFGRAMRAAGMIEIQRDNRKAAFGAYDVAAERIRGGKPSESAAANRSSSFRRGRAEMRIHFVRSRRAPSCWRSPLGCRSSRSSCMGRSRSCQRAHFGLIRAQLIYICSSPSARPESTTTTAKR
jgi:1-acyl-sn-glycerol-3-phosphate acyltransferase